METGKHRIDKYLWAIRIFKTRSLAAEACAKGKVKENGDSVKASRNIKIGDRFEIKTSDKKWVIQVSGLIQQRVQFSEAIKYYLDLTPEEETNRIKLIAATFNTGKRLSKIGRPTKKDKRNLDDFLSEP